MMRRCLALTMLLALPSCDANFFTDQMALPDDIPCSDAGTCPPNEVCVPGEHFCRYACAADGSCPIGHIANLSCDVDHFCRQVCGNGGPAPVCNGMQSSPGLAGCPTGQICDVNGAVSLCRPICSGLPDATVCSSGFTCATLSDTVCGGCRPST